MTAYDRDALLRELVFRFKEDSGEYRDMEVPEVLTSGNHRRIHLWRLEQSLELTAKRRPEMLVKYARRRETLDKEERRLLDSTLQAYDLYRIIK